jgi:hypothetical protein
MKKIALLCLLGASLFAYSDNDLDGVPNNIDQCPNTPITELVGADGCSVTTPARAYDKNKDHYDIIVGADVGRSDYQLTPKTDIYTSSLQLDYYHKAFSFQLSSLYYYTKASDYSSSGIGDTTLTGYYSLYPNNALTLKIGTGVILPTYNSSLNNNKTDYLGSIYGAYQKNNFILFGTYVYTVINDTNVNDATNNINYQNTNAYNIGLGYAFTQKFYASVSYYQANSIYKDVQDLQNIALSLFYSIDKHWFTSLSYAAGLNNATSQSYGSLKLGYYF